MFCLAKALSVDLSTNVNFKALIEVLLHFLALLVIPGPYSIHQALIFQEESNFGENEFASDCFFEIFFSVKIYLVSFHQL